MRELPLPTLPLSDLLAPAAHRRSLHPGSQPPRLEVAWARAGANDEAQRLRRRIALVTEKR